MKYDSRIHHRRSIRLKGYDYSGEGLYFITICTDNMQCLFGQIVDDKMVLNDAGNITKKCWCDIPQHYPHIKLYEFIVMPNHVHGIVGAENIPPVHGAENIPPVQQRHRNIPLGNIIRGFKIGVTKWFQANMSCPIGHSVWHRNYWEHIIRNDDEFSRITDYIRSNPTKWHNDKLNGGNGNKVMELEEEYAHEVWMV